MSEEDLSGHFHTYPKTYDPNVPKLNPQNLRLAIFAKIQASAKNVSLVQIVVHYSHDFEQKFLTSKKCSFHDASRLD